MRLVLGPLLLVGKQKFVEITYRAWIVKIQSEVVLRIQVLEDFSVSPVVVRDLEESEVIRLYCVVTFIDHKDAVTRVVVVDRGDSWGDNLDYREVRGQRTFA